MGSGQRSEYWALVHVVITLVTVVVATGCGEKKSPTPRVTPKKADTPATKQSDVPDAPQPTSDVQPATGARGPNGGANSDAATETAGTPKPTGSAGPGSDSQARKTRPNAGRAAQTKKYDDPRAAEAAAESLLTSAERSCSAGQVGQAFEQAVEAWEIAQQHASDAKCREVAARAIQLAERFGENTNQGVQRIDSKTPITVK